MSPHHIAVLLFEKFSNHCLANAIEPLRAANTLATRNVYTWEFVTLDGKQVMSSSGLPIMPTKKLSDLARVDDLFVLSSYDYDTLSTANCSRALRLASKNARRIVGMDTGAWPIAKAGLLDGKNATIHWDALEDLAECFPQLNVLEDRFVKHNNVATTGGVSTTFDFILDMIEQDHGSLLRLEVAVFFRHGNRGHLSDPLLRLTGHQKVDAAVALMRRNIEHPLQINEIASMLQMHPKKLVALFIKVTQDSPKRIYKHIRLREAKRLIEVSRYSIGEIALRVGYQNHAAFTRAFREEFGKVPKFFQKNSAI